MIPLTNRITHGTIETEKKGIVGRRFALKYWQKNSRYVWDTGGYFLFWLLLPK